VFILCRIGSYLKLEVFCLNLWRDWRQSGSIELVKLVQSVAGRCVKQLACLKWLVLWNYPELVHSINGVTTCWSNGIASTTCLEIFSSQFGPNGGSYFYVSCCSKTYFTQFKTVEAVGTFLCSSWSVDENLEGWIHFMDLSRMEC